MARKRYTTEDIIRMLREAEVELAQGQAMVSVLKKLGVTANTYDRWRKEYGGLKVDPAKRRKDLEREPSSWPCPQPTRRRAPRKALLT